MPALVSLLMVFSLLGQALVDQSRARHLCRKQTLKTQSQVAQSIETLLSLNAKARRLRFARKSALSALTMATLSSPQLVPIARSALQKITHQQHILHGQQKALLNKIESTWRVGQRQLRSLLSRPELKSLSIRMARSALVPVPPNSLSPSYQLVPGYSKLHRLGASWRLKLNGPLGWIGKSELSWTASCAATVTKENGIWVSGLTVVK